jgi:RNA polymerase sigma factor (sigma-70 family)
VTAAERGATLGNEPAALVARVQQGDATAEEEVARAFRRRVLVMMLSRTRDRAVADDLTQETLIAVLRALRSGQVREPERLGAFVLGTARNVLNGYFRTRSRMPEVVPIAASMLLADPVLEFEAADQRARAQRALQSLDGDDRRVLVLTLVEGLKPGEIAELLGLSGEVVRARKSRALKRLVDRMRTPSRLASVRPQD